MLEKVLQGKHQEEITPEMLDQIRDGIYDPIAVFASATEEGSVVVLTEVISKQGNRIVVPVQIVLENNPGSKISWVKSIYGKENSEVWANRQAGAGRLLYVNTKKAAASNLSDVAPFARPDRRQAHHDKELKASQPVTRILTENDIVKPEVKYSKDGKIQGFYLNGKAYLVEDGIAEGQAMGVLLHELGEHAAQLGFRNKEYQKILGDIESRQNEQGETGEAIRAAMARVPKKTAPEHYWSEVAAYLVEQNADKGLRLVDRIVAFFKNLLLRAGISPSIVTTKDLAAFAHAAVRAEARKAGKTQRATGFMASMAENLGVSEAQLQREYDAVVKRYKGTAQWLKAPNGKKSNLNERQWVLVRTPRFKAWFGDFDLSASMKVTENFIDQVLRGERPVNIAVGSVDGKAAGKIKQLTGINTKGREFELVADDIVHAIKGHGKQKREAQRGQVALTVDDLKLLPIVLRFPTTIAPGSTQYGRQSVRFEKKINGTLVVVEIVPSTGGSLQFKTAWKRPSETADAFSASHTSETDPSPPHSYNQTVQRLLEQSKTSVMLDENGEPRVVYHSTRGDFSVFKDQPASDLGFHFGTAEQAEERLDATRGKYHVAGQGLATEAGESVMPVFVSIKNPLRVEDPGYFSAGDDAFYQELTGAGIEIERGSDSATTARAIEDAGYDGLVYENESEGGQDSFATLNSAQIKSATGNTGAFDGSNPDIRYSKAATPEAEARHNKEFSEDFNDAYKEVKKKLDIWAATPFFKTAEYTLGKIGAGQRMLEAAMRKMENKVKLENEILDGISPDADPEVYAAKYNSFINTFKALRKHSVESYNKVRDYMLKVDREGIGYFLQHVPGYAVHDPDGKFLGVGKTKEDAREIVKRNVEKEYGGKSGSHMVSKHQIGERADFFRVGKREVSEHGEVVSKLFGRPLQEGEAVQSMMNREHKDLLENGFSEQEADAILTFRAMSNRAFDRLVADWRAALKRYEELGMDPPSVEILDESRRWAVRDKKGKNLATFGSRAEAETMLRALAKTHPRFGNTDALIVRQKDSEIKKDANLSDAIAMLGDMRGTYFPRQRKNGASILIAVNDKTGERILEKGDLYWHDLGDEHPNVAHKKLTNRLRAGTNWMMPLAKRARELKRQGFDVRIERDTSMPESVFEVEGLVSAMTSMTDDALAKAREGDLTAEEKRAFEVIHKAMINQIAGTIQQRGFLSSRQKRSENYWQGFETDPLKAGVSYAKGLAGGIAKRKLSQDLTLAFTGRDISWEQWKEDNSEGAWDQYAEFVSDRKIDPKEQKNLYAEGISWMRELLRNDETGDRVIGTMKGLAALKYLGFRVSSAAVNLTSLAITVPATISSHTGRGRRPRHGPVCRLWPACL